MLHFFPYFLPRLALIKDGKPQVYAYASRGYRHGFVSAVLRLTVSSKVSVELQQGALYEPRGNRAYTVLTGIIVGVDLRLMQSDRRLTSLRIIGSISDRVRAITAAEHDDVP